jgi:hypothetical protein
MPLELQLQVIRASDFVRVSPQSGRPDFERSKTTLWDLARACRERGVHRALLDLRDVQPEPTPFFTHEQLMALVRLFHDVGFSNDQRLAVLYTTDPHDGVKFFAAISRESGWNVKAFADYEQGLNWLALTEQRFREAA